MFKFLRFDIGGASCLLCMMLFVAPYLNVEALVRIDSTKLFAIVFGSITLSIPLGNYIHQITDTLFNPFQMNRLLFWRRAALVELKSILGNDARKFRDETFQAIFVFSKTHARSQKMVGKKETTTDFKVDLYREEISNRYSYYYARLENGLIAPILGFITAKLVILLFSGTIYFLQTPAIPTYWIGAVLGFICISVLWRIPQIFRELDDLEVALVKYQMACWRQLPRFFH